jgi:metal-responsive CopG/Arc/MetJ family transcriptional regulator
MKTAISIPDPLNDSIEAFLERAKMSRSEFFQRAARHYLDRIAAQAIKANLDRVYETEESPADLAFRRAAISHFRDLSTNEPS